MAKGDDKYIPIPWPLKGWDINWARHDQPSLTTPDALNVFPFDLDKRSRLAKRPGLSVLTGGSVGTIPSTYREMRLCETDALAGYFVPTLDLSSYPTTFSYAGACYYVTNADDTTETPSGIITSALERTNFSDCETCAEELPPPPATYQRVRRCTDNSLTTFYIATSGLTYPYFLLRAADDQCYKVLEAEPLTTTVGTLVGTSTSKASCAACAGDQGGGGTTNYYQALSCVDDTPLDCWIDEGCLDGDPYDLPFYFRRYDISTPVCYIPADAVTSTSPGRVYGCSEENLKLTSSCTEGCGACFEDSMPATATVTFSGVVPQTAWKLADNASGYFRTTGVTINTTFTLDKTTDFDGSCQYIGTLSGSHEAHCPTVDDPSSTATYGPWQITLLLTETAGGVIFSLRVSTDGNSDNSLLFVGDSARQDNCRATVELSNDNASPSQPACLDQTGTVGSGGTVVISVDF